MKQYFAKYRPVEGEIKENTKVFAREKGIKIVKSIIQIPDNDEDLQDILEFTDKSRFPKTACKLAKLFLCSRDNPDYKQEILTEGIKEGQEFTEKEIEYLISGYFH